MLSEEHLSPMNSIEVHWEKWQMAISAPVNLDSDPLEATPWQV